MFYKRWMFFCRSGEDDLIILKKNDEWQALLNQVFGIPETLLFWVRGVYGESSYDIMVYNRHVKLSAPTPGPYESICIAVEVGNIKHIK